MNLKNENIKKKKKEIVYFIIVLSVLQINILTAFLVLSQVIKMESINLTCLCLL